MNAKKNGDQYKGCQTARSTVYVDANGTATTRGSDHLREAAENNIHYVPEHDRWIPKPISGATVVSPLPSWLI